ncbi:MAG: ROK family protein [Turneriella sp.]
MTKGATYPILGIDIGATSIKFASLLATGELVSRGSEPVASGSNEQLIGQLAGIVARPEFAECTAVGIGSPGPLDLSGGVIVASANMPGVKNCPLVPELSKRFSGKQFRLDNDANAATLGEWFFGAGKGAVDLAVFTLGTGVGGGCVFNGRLQRGFNGNFFEVGHIPVAAFPPGNDLARRCGCGSLGCLETLASATGISETYYLQTGKRCTAAEIAQRAYESDAAAVAAYTIAAQALGLAAAMLTQVMNLTVFIFTGGVAAAANLLKPIITQTWQEHTLPVFHRQLRITFTLGDEHAGIRGAAALFLEEQTV